MPQTCFHHPRLMAYPSAVAFFSMAVGAKLDEALERMRALREYTDGVTRAFKDHPDRNKIVGATVGLAVKSFMRPPAVDTGGMYWEDKELGLWANAPYSWCDRVVVLRDSRFVDDLTRDGFASKYPGMLRVPDDPRESTWRCAR